MKSENNFNHFVLNYAKELKMNMILTLCFKLNQELGNNVLRVHRVEERSKIFENIYYIIVRKWKVWKFS